MAVYSLSALVSSVPQSVAACEVRSTSAHKPKIMEFGFNQVTVPGTTDLTAGLGRPAAIGMNPGGPVKTLDESDGNAPGALTMMATAWGTAPTVPANFFRRSTIPRSTVGVGAIWCFPRGIGIPITSSVVLWTIAVASTVDLDMWTIVEE